MRSGTLGRALEVVTGTRRAAATVTTMRPPSRMRRFMGFLPAELTRELEALPSGWGQRLLRGGLAADGRLGAPVGAWDMHLVGRSR
jgi:hypothetical protein